MDTFLTDVRTALRGLRAAPWFTAAIITTLAVAIGANTLIFSVVNGVLLNPLAFGNADRLVAVSPGAVHRQGGEMAISAPDFVDWRGQITKLDALAAYESVGTSLQEKTEAIRLRTANVSANWFSLLGVGVQQGRAFANDEDQPGHPKVVVMSDALWRSRFGGDPHVVGTTLKLNGDPYTVVGIAPPHFTYPHTPDLWVARVFDPSQLTPDARGNHFLTAIGRVAPGATVDGARQEFETVTERLRLQYMQADADFHYTLKPLRERMVGDARPALLVLFGAVGCVLLIACANVANLLLVRASSRRAELSVRVALGAGRGRIVRQLLTESVMLALLGAITGVALAYGGIRLLVAARPGNLPRLEEVTLDGRVLLFTAVITLVTGVLFGLAPAIQAASPDIVESLKSGLRGASASRRTSRLRGTLVVAETALAVLLLIGAGLLTRSFARMMAVDPGFVPEQVARFDVYLPGAQYRTWAQIRGFTNGVLQKLQALPGTVAAAEAFGVPFGEVGARSTFHVDGRAPDPPEHPPLAVVEIVTPRFFTALGITIRRGRAFTDDDRQGGHKVMIVNEALVREYFPGEDPIGKRVAVDWDSDSSGHKDTVIMGGEIVGIVADVHDNDLRAPVRPALYAAFAQSAVSYQSYVVRTKGDPRTVLTAARQIVASVDPTVPIFNVSTYTDAVRESVAQPRLYAAVVGTFAFVALLLSVIGIYGVLAYSVRERRRELGIRIALGARESQVVRMVVGQGMRLAVIGLAVGFVVALLGGRVLASLLYNIRPNDPPTFEVVSISLILVAAVASWLPARRAAIIDPVIAMRPE